MSRRPVVILTALDLEYQAIREKLVDPSLHRHAQGTHFEVGGLAGGRCRVALAQIGSGNQSAAVLAERAIQEFAPAALLFVGLAGALAPGIVLGDVVVATHVYAYHGGKSDDAGFKSRPRVWETSHAVEQIAQHIARGRSWPRDLPEGDPIPRVHFGPIAAGEVVLKSTDSSHARWIDERYNDAKAIEMEGAGVAQAGHLNRSLPVAVVRGISNRADRVEPPVHERWLWRAAANAAAFAAVLADELADDVAGEPTGGPAERSGMPETVRNIAQGNARVGVQAGTVYGGIRMGSEPIPPDDPGEALADFRAHLRRARSDGHLDEDTYEAVEAELTAADEALATNTPQGGKKLTLALKKARGLIADVPALAAEAENIIALARDLS
ncbi:5'-methylthioadenosine/S-adenosylhomocysteine nucleosidase family protein [Actinoallomurus acaciae]|uniref:Purine phosphorylase n=1 Tax=Actinoallomurus acaciae TaxID=502577 RepID=A0ABV5YRS3_9ACTN